MLYYPDSQNTSNIVTQIITEGISSVSTATTVLPILSLDISMVLNPDLLTKVDQEVQIIINLCLVKIETLLLNI